MADIMEVCKAGAAGCCSVILLILGVFVCFPGLTLLVVGSVNNNEDNDFYDDSNRELQIIGGVLLAVGVGMIAGAIFMCCYVCRKVNTPSSANQGTVLAMNPSQTSAVVTTTYSPVPSSQGNYPPPVQQHPAMQQYPPGQHYPGVQQYPAPQYPQQHYQKTQQAPAPIYHPQGYDHPPPHNPNYPQPAQATAPYPTLDKPAPPPSAPPQHVMSFKR